MLEWGEIMEDTKPRIRVELRLKAKEKALLWKVAKERKTTASELVRDFIHSLEK